MAAFRQLDLSKVFHCLWRGRLTLFAGTVICTAAAAFYAYVLATPVYRSQAIVALQDSNSTFSSQLSGVASLAGLALGSNGNATQAQRVAVLSSRAMVEKLIRGENLLPVLFPNDGAPLFGVWARKPHTMGTAVDFFVQNVRHIDENTRNGLVTIQVDWKDPALAARWAGELIRITNQHLRDTAIAEAERNIEYLKNEEAGTVLDSARQAIVRLNEANLNQLMLAKAQEEFAFKVIDAPEISEPDRYIAPRRGADLAAGLIIGFLLSALFVLWPQRRSFFTVNPDFQQI